MCSSATDCVRLLNRAAASNLAGGVQDAFCYLRSSKSRDYETLLGATQIDKIRLFSLGMCSTTKQRDRPLNNVE